MTPPACRLCGKNHWAREGCQFAAIIKGVKHEIHVDGLKLPKGSIVLVSRPNTSREGRRVLKAEAARPDATRTASTERSDPPTPRLQGQEQATAEKARPGKPKTAQRTKKKGKTK